MKARDRDLVILHGGGCDGWVYYRDDILVRQLAYESVGHGLPFTFKPTGRKELQPGNNSTGRLCEIWEAT